MLLQETELSLLVQDQDVLMDGMIRHDAYPILLQQETIQKVADPESGDILETSSNGLVRAYISSPKIQQAIELQHEFERILDLISPRRQCRCAEERERLDELLYGDGDENPGLEAAVVEFERSSKDARANLESICRIYGVESINGVDEEINSLLTRVESLSGKGAAHEKYAEMLNERVASLVDFNSAYSQQERVLSNMDSQLKEFKKRIKETHAAIKAWPKNVPRDADTCDVIECGKCGATIPVPLHIIYQDDAELETCSQILFGETWAAMRERLPFSQIKTVMTAIYSWAFKPLENVNDPFGQSMAEIMGMLTKRLPKNRRWLRYLMSNMQSSNGSNAS